MKKLSWDNIIQDVNALFVAGKREEADETLTKALAKGSVPRRWLVQLSPLLCRMERAFEALALLGPHVIPTENKPADASKEELVEYAFALVYGGLGHGANKVLSDIQGPFSSRYYYVKASVHTVLHQYPEAITAFDHYLERTDHTPFENLAARLNLGVIISRSGKDAKTAEKIYQELLRDAHDKEFKSIYASTSEELAYLALHSGHPELCLERLEGYKKELGSPGPLREIFFSAYAALSRLALKNGKDAQALREINELKDVLRERSQWNVVRTVTLYEALIRNDADLLLRLYFTVNLRGLKERLREALVARSITIPPNFDIYVGPPGNIKTKRLTLDLHTGAFDERGRLLKTGQLTQRTLHILGADPFRRFRLLDIYDLLYPGVLIGIHSARERTEQALSQFRRWIRTEGLPLEVKTEKGLYWLEAQAPMAFRLINISALDESKKAVLIDHAIDEALELLRKTFDKKTFTLPEVMACLETSRRSAQRRLEGLVEAGLVQRTGKGPSTRFFIKLP